MAETTNLQRVNATGGVAPAAGCDPSSIGTKQRIPFAAENALLAK